MTDVTLYGFPISTYVNVVRLVLTHKGVPFEFFDLEAGMGGPRHLALHPFGRVPILDHAGFRVYETAAIATYVDEAFDGPSLQPSNVKARARMLLLSGSAFPERLPRRRAIQRCLLLPSFLLKRRTFERSGPIPRNTSRSGPSL